MNDDDDDSGLAIKVGFLSLFTDQRLLSFLHKVHGPKEIRTVLRWGTEEQFFSEYPV